MIFSSKRKSAETFTYLLSLLIVGSVFIYLIYGIYSQKDSEFLDLEAKIEWEKVKTINGKKVIPVRISNNGHKTPAEASFSVELRNQPYETFEVTYLGRGDSTEVFLSIPEDVGPQELTITLHHYLF